MGWFDGEYDLSGMSDSGSDWFSGDSSWLDGSSGGDYSDLGNWAFGGGDSGGSLDGVGWGDLSGTGGEGGSGGGGSYSWLSSLFGGSGSGSGSSNIFGALLSGLSGAAGSWMDSKNAEKAMKMKGEQDRKSIAFGADLQDYYAQKNKGRKRAALDTYGQFSQLKRWAPSYVNTPAVDVPTKPNAGSY